MTKQRWSTGESLAWALIWMVLVILMLLSIPGQQSWLAVTVISIGTSIIATLIIRLVHQIRS